MRTDRKQSVEVTSIGAIWVTTGTGHRECLSPTEADDLVRQLTAAAKKAHRVQEDLIRRYLEERRGGHR